MSDDIETKLSTARTRLILDRPFLGALVLRMPMKAAVRCWVRSTHQVRCTKCTLHNACTDAVSSVRSVATSTYVR
jgi:hypothetical protein